MIPKKPADMSKPELHRAIGEIIDWIEGSTVPVQEQSFTDPPKVGSQPKNPATWSMGETKRSGKWQWYEGPTGVKSDRMLLNREGMSRMLVNLTREELLEAEEDLGESLRPKAEPTPEVEE